MTSRATAGNIGGLSELRRAGAVSELLFLYEILAHETVQLRPVAERLGLTVQAVSHMSRLLQKAGRVEVRGGRYRPTIAGVAWLHSALGGLRADLEDRWSRLSVIRTCRAVAREPLSRGIWVTLALREGVLTAGRGAGESRGKTLHAARRGEIVEVGSLEGIVPVEAAPIEIVTFTDGQQASAELRRALTRRVRGDAGLVAAWGIEATQLLRRSEVRPFVRFGVAAAASEAARVGVPVTIVAREEELPRLLSQFDPIAPPRLTVTPLLRSNRGARPSRSARQRA
jgi:predicted transcriptional regulator